MESYNLGTFLLMWGIAFLLTRVGLSVMFKKAGINQWLAFIPIVSWWFWIKLVGRPAWYMVGMVIPCVNILFSFNITLDILRAFGQFKFWQQFLGTVFTFIYFPYLALKHKSLKYLGQSGTQEWRDKNVPAPKHGREWADAILFAMYVAGGMRGLYFDLFQIPTSSMESNMLVGDFLVVNRANVGMRIPMTPITVPAIAHQELPFGGIKAYSDIVQLPYMRLPGWHAITNNDIVVFNVPWNSLNPDEMKFPVDKKTYYVKRCVGIAGDKLEIKDRQVYINGKALALKNKAQRNYTITFKAPFVPDYDWLGENELGEIQGLPGHEGIYSIHTWADNIEKIKKDPNVLKVDILNRSESINAGNQYFSDTFFNKWTKDNWGPYYLPKRGDEITLNHENFIKYEKVMKFYEHSEVTESAGKYYLNGEEITKFKFKYNYYFLMGDNRDNSLDSRFWGMVPETHIVGIPSFSFFSLHKINIIDGSGENNDQNYKTVGVNWDRIFKFFD